MSQTEGVAKTTPAQQQRLENTNQPYSASLEIDQQPLQQELICWLSTVSQVKIKFAGSAQLAPGTAAE